MKLPLPVYFVPALLLFVFSAILGATASSAASHAMLRVTYSALDDNEGEEAYVRHLSRRNQIFLKGDSRRGAISSSTAQQHTKNDAAFDTTSDDSGGGRGGSGISRRELKKKSGKNKKSKGNKSPLKLKETCLLTGFEAVGSSETITGEIFDQPAIVSTCGPIGAELLLDPTSEDLLEDYYECLESFGVADYPLTFSTGGPSTEWSFTEQAGALNGEAYCVNLAGDAANKGRIEEADVDFLLTDTEITSFQYDYYVGTCGNKPTPCGSEFYLNIYLSLATPLPVPPNPAPNSGPRGFYQCKYDVVPPNTNGQPGAWYTQIMDPATTNRDDVRSHPSCPATLDLAFADPTLVLGSSVYNWALNIGDTGADDNGLEGCLDNIQYGYDGEVRIFDLQSNA